MAHFPEVLVFKFLGGLVIWAAAHLGLFPFFSPIVVSIVQGAAVVFAALGLRDVIGDGSVVTAWLDGLKSGWKTLIGSLTAVLGYLLSPAVLAQIPAKVAMILTTFGTILAALGIYHASVAKRAGARR